MDNLKSHSSKLLLPLLTLMYVVGELGHFLIGVLSRPMAQTIGFGDKSCLAGNLENNSQNSWVFCKDFSSEAGCVLARAEADTGIQPCEWNFNGLGTDYQVLAGPAFMFLFTTSGVLWGIAADKFNRIYLLGFATICCGLAITLTSLATEYWHLVLLRMGVAAGASACTPLAASLLADAYPPNKRALAMGIFNCGIYFGFGLSFSFGYITDTTIFSESWRLCFLISGIPAIVVAVIFLLIIKEPRGNANETDTNIEMSGKQDVSAETKQEGTWVSLFELVKRPEVLILIIAACIRHSAGYTWGYNSFLYFQTYFEDFDAGWWLTGISIIAGVIGATIGGFVADRVQVRWGMSARPLVLGASQLIATPFTVAMLYLSPPYALIPLAMSYLASEVWFGVMYAILVELVPSNFKSTAVAVALFVVNNAGGNLPVLVGPLTAATDYRTAILIMDPGALLTSSVGFFTCWILLRRRKS